MVTILKVLFEKKRSLESWCAQQNLHNLKTWKMLGVFESDLYAVSFLHCGGRKSFGFFFRVVCDSKKKKKKKKTKKQDNKKNLVFFFLFVCV